MRLFLYCVLSLASCRFALAQGTIPDSPIKMAADRFLAKTQADYYPDLIKKRTMTARVAACDESACRATGLPVTLIKFEGQRIDDNNVALAWETSEETNNDYFELQRTLNPRLGFTTVAKVKGSGTTASLKSYKHNDPNDYPSYTYYRLKQVDLDSTYAYSAIISIRASSASFTVTAIPNPGQGKDIAFKVSGLKTDEQFTSVIYNVRGAVVYADHKPRTVSDEQIIRPALTDLIPGKYSIKIKSAERQTTGSFVIIE